MMTNYQNTFSKVMKQEGFEGLLRKMKLQRLAGGK